MFVKQLVFTKATNSFRTFQIFRIELSDMHILLDNQSLVDCVKKSNQALSRAVRHIQSNPILGLKYPTAHSDRSLHSTL